ncbi:hypothetical protein MG293_011052 [Ovis ammon polii]|uniref:Uncharacterized protein n=1 Tax=Ovis ammon polii TaxID=230172 RepID=A0AAD4U774_OVIAM|nr:hypothetical protein MG293_011052 [Ovis ammon polii]
MTSHPVCFPAAKTDAQSLVCVSCAQDKFQKNDTESPPRDEHSGKDPKASSRPVCRDGNNLQSPSPPPAAAPQPLPPAAVSNTTHAEMFSILYHLGDLFKFRVSPLLLANSGGMSCAWGPLLSLARPTCSSDDSERCSPKEEAISVENNCPWPEFVKQDLWGKDEGRQQEEDKYSEYIK